MSASEDQDLWHVGGKSYVAGGITYTTSGVSTNRCQIVNDTIDVSMNTEKYTRFLCGFNQEVFITIGDASKGHNLMIQSEHGTIVNVNGHMFTIAAELTSLGDGSWSVTFDANPHEEAGNWLKRLYEGWLNEVINKLGHMGMIDVSPLYVKRFSRLIGDSKPKGLILSQRCA